LALTAIATPEHNAIFERFFRTLTEECIWSNLFESFEESDKIILVIYNDSTNVIAQSKQRK
jgi:hypothetical protein